MQLPRIMIGATGSGSGKTLITCGILQALVNRGLHVASFKCGPDYIDPMFHSKILGIQSKNLDSFLSNKETLRYLFGKTAKEAEISVMEGVMGFYDGLAGISTRASSYEVAKITKTPVILIIPCKGMSLSILAMIQGFLHYRQDNRIVGVILNQISQNLYMELKVQIEKELNIKVLGYVPYVKELVIESRHLGLVKPDEIEDFHRKLNSLSEVMEETLELDTMIEIARNVQELFYKVPIIHKIEGQPCIAIARDEAFCFYYQDNLELLQEMGAKLIEFSPIHDRTLPQGVNGLILGGGYPELVAEQLSKNITMREDIKKKLENGLPCMAECGGFLYLHQQMEDMKGHRYPMVGSIGGLAYPINRLGRFGYITLTANYTQMIGERGESIAGHEYHYFDSSLCGDSFTAQKPLRKTAWQCIHGKEQLAAGFPHLYYYSNQKIPYRFLEQCVKWGNKK